MSAPRASRWPSVAAAGLALCLVTAPATVAAEPADMPGGDGWRVVAVGDIHGAYDAFRSILLETELVSEDDRWAGGRAVLVQTGDFLDRGAESLRVARWLMELQGQAAEAGGRVVVLLGNHEAMNLLGDLRFVTPEMVQPMVDRNSEKRRLAACKEHAAILRRDAKALKLDVPPAADLRRQCLAEVALGRVEYQASLESDQPLGRWLRSLPAVTRVGGTVFLHGGISPEMAPLGLAAINETVRRELEQFDTWRRWLVDHGRMVRSATLQEMAGAVQVELELRRRHADEGLEPDPAAPDFAAFQELGDSLLLAPHGPLWFRDYDTWDPEVGSEEVSGILQALKARRLVVAHTPQEPRRITCRFSGRVFLIDTGMLADYYEGTPAALEITDAGVFAVYPGERIVLVEAADDLRVAETCR